MQSLISLILRLSAVGGKFVALAVLADASGAHEVGAFGLFFGLVNIFLFVIGLDFHLFSIRELIARRTMAGRARVIVGQAALDGTIYAVVLILGLVGGALSFSGMLGIPLIWFVSILVCDHLAQELSRAFLVLKRPNAANIIYAVKTGLWGWAGAAAIYLRMMSASAESFYFMWLCADLSAIVLGTVLLLHTFRGTRTGLPPHYGAWIRRGLHVSKVFYLTSVATMCLAYLDRFVIAQQVSLAQAGLYTFWQSIAALLPVVVYAMAGMHFLPRMVEAYKRKRDAEFLQLQRQFLKRTVMISIVTGLVILLLAAWIPILLGKDEFSASPTFVAILVAAAALNALWQMPYQTLYSVGQDRYLASTLVFVTLLALLLNVLAVPGFGITGAAVVSAISNGTVCLVLGWQAYRYQRGRSLTEPPAQADGSPQAHMPSALHSDT